MVFPMNREDHVGFTCTQYVVDSKIKMEIFYLKPNKSYLNLYKPHYEKKYPFPFSFIAIACCMQ